MSYNQLNEKRKMAYINDGSTHHEGIENEKQIVKSLNFLLKDNDFQEFITGFLKELYEEEIKIEEFVHIGGTKEKDDIRAIDANAKNIFGISVKQHKGSTWDFFNTSSLQEYLGDLGIEIKKEFDKIRKKGREEILSLPITSPEITKIKKKYDQVLMNFSNEFIEKIDSDSIKKFLKKIREGEPELLAIRRVCFKELHLISKKKRTDLKKYFDFKETDIFSLKQKAGAKQSRSIYKNNEDTGLRLRLVSNNGTSALIGMNNHKKKGNKNSSITLKLQNDNVVNLYRESDYIIKK